MCVKKSFVILSSNDGAGAFNIKPKKETETMNYHKPTILSTLQSYGPEYQQFRDALKESTDEELEQALKSIYHTLEKHLRAY